RVPQGRREPDQGSGSRPRMRGVAPPLRCPRPVEGIPREMGLGLQYPLDARDVGEEASYPGHQRRAGLRHEHWLPTSVV
ncbi:unnamed protein product, partial [Darwinula stevensoni]